MSWMTRRAVQERSEHAHRSEPIPAPRTDCEDPSRTRALNGVTTRSADMRHSRCAAAPAGPGAARGVRVVRRSADRDEHARGGAGPSQLASSPADRLAGGDPRRGCRRCGHTPLPTKRRHGPRAARLLPRRRVGARQPRHARQPGEGARLGERLRRPLCRLPARTRASFPAGLEDAFTAAAWACGNAAALGCDAGRLAIGGDSAGANLAAVVTQAGTLPYRFQLLVYPVTDARGGTASYEEHKADRGSRKPG